MELELEAEVALRERSDFVVGVEAALSHQSADPEMKLTRTLEGRHQELRRRTCMIWF